ncbi:RHS repeat-associated core domain-containing protein [Micromonospora sp. DT229]|uniref:RHS repeat-associated core domain-containing protein n=1 Tax=Micromonospora sp. DT229 TaxID=3393430 RepID=UPI003CEC8CC6
MRLGYQGGWTDASTGLVNAHSRWYAPTTGSFVSRDTMTLTPNPVAQANRYGYGNASPVNFTDPDGHNPIAVPLVGVALASGPVGWIALGVVSVGAAIWLAA